jgi:hypothetical protein
LQAVEDANRVARKHEARGRMQRELIGDTPLVRWPPVGLTVVTAASRAE